MNTSGNSFLKYLIENLKVTAYCWRLQRDSHWLIIGERKSRGFPSHWDAVYFRKPSRNKWMGQALSPSSRMRKLGEEWPPPIEILRAVERHILERRHTKRKATEWTNYKYHRSWHTKQSKKLKPLLLAKQWTTCRYCGANLPPEMLTVDHRLPISRGGKTSLSNCVLHAQDATQRKEIGRFKR